MSTDPNSIIDHLGGTSAVARMIKAPTSTVHSWRSKGIPASRLEHLKLLAQVNGITLPSEVPQRRAKRARPTPTDRAA